MRRIPAPDRRPGQGRVRNDRPDGGEAICGPCMSVDACKRAETPTAQNRSHGRVGGCSHKHAQRAAHEATTWPREAQAYQLDHHRHFACREHHGECESKRTEAWSACPPRDDVEQVDGQPALRDAAIADAGRWYTMELGDCGDIKSAAARAENDSTAHCPDHPLARAGGPPLTLPSLQAQISSKRAAVARTHRQRSRISFRTT